MHITKKEFEGKKEQISVKNETQSKWEVCPIFRGRASVSHVNYLFISNPRLFLVWVCVSKLQLPMVKKALLQTFFPGTADSLT